MYQTKQKSEGSANHLLVPFLFTTPFLIPFLISGQSTITINHVMINPDSNALPGRPLLADHDGNRQSSTPTPVTLLVVFSTLIAVLGSAVTGLASGYSSPSESGIMEDLGLSGAEYSLFGSMLTIGASVSSLVNGKITDVIGRRYTMGLSVAFSMVGWLLIAVAQNAWCLDVGRLLIGVGVGITAYVVPVYIAEITPRTVRGAFTSLNQFSLCCGFSFVYFLGTVASWRVLALTGVFPCVLQMIGIFLIPESPRWLAKVSRENELEATLQSLRGKDADISQEAAEIREFTKAFEQESSRVLDMFQWKYARPLIIAIGLLIFQPLGGLTAIAYYASSIFESAGFSSNVGTICMAILQIPMTGLSVLLTDRAGRRPLLLVSSAGMCLSCTLIGMAFCFQNVTRLEAATPVMVFSGIMAYTVFYSIGIASLPWVMLSEVLPISIKGTAGSLASLVNWVSSWVVAYTFNFMFDWSAAGTFFIFAAMCGLTLVFEATIVPETKGRSLEELQASLTNFFSKDTTIVD
ncbi:hypothetical protein MLD38_016425 [Melastoma candidum]|uniref:Uncharacterized protein n=1 Tax=Melastoma candidum TaxID=119954 RepID=A0ACB9RIZ0_9MYRT|nr:hypothetical protein MLD38_016425 [Melastoma candidum]